MKLTNRSFTTPRRKLNDLCCDIAFKLQLEGLNVSAKQHLVGHKVDNMANTQYVAYSYVNAKLLTKYS
jgi:hypothetical protein